MSPEQITALTSLLSIMDKMSGWPFGLLFFMIVVGPWVLAIMLAYGYRKRFESVVGMYQANVRLVEKFIELSGDLKEVVIMNTQAWQRTCDAVEKNQFCPQIRLQKSAVGVQG
ncbi:MAG: hypothetical protein CVU57_04275 [Deltaproteobacteria bacterium HGW-Deltaproteobacteria-15]|jgi:hypothetical protein|nr:MAG: hypothetical protein CVU57_04275 [Deltaproteobacteria bacterium HGW-Deltaproteobacteria-15]